MDYFSKFLRPGLQPPPKPQTDHAQEFHKSWNFVKNTLAYPDERQLSKGIKSTTVPAHLQSMVDSLVWESNRTEEGGTGACLEYLLKNDILGTLVRLSESDRPSGIQAEVLRAVQNMVVLLDEQFLVHSAVHRAVLRLLRNCVGDDLQEQLDGKDKLMGAAKNAVRSQPSEYEEDLVNLLCILCSRIRTYRELLIIFFHDKHWYRSEPLFSVEEEDEDESEESDQPTNTGDSAARDPSPTPSQATITDAPPPLTAKKPEYEFLLFNYLLRFVHREGQIGDFARAGLLFLMDVAMSPQDPVVNRLAGDAKAPSTGQPATDPITDAALALAEYVLDGDFSEVLGAGLGAVYSVLPSKLEFHPQIHSDVASGNSMVIGGTGPEAEDELEWLDVEKARARAMGVEDAADPDFKSRLDHFLKLLEFLQDVFRRNRAHDGLDESTLVGSAIVQSILDAVRRTFLENVFYPSVLECSDLDGSSVAVMSYVDIMIRTLQEGQLAELFVDFLMSEDNDELRPQSKHISMLTLDSMPPQSSSGTGADRQSRHRKRKSSAMFLLEMENPETRKPTEYATSVGRFTLKDLLMSNFRSTSQRSATAALQLLNSVLLFHPVLSTERLLLVLHDQNATSYPHPALLAFAQKELNAITRPTEPEEDDEDEEFHYPGLEEPKEKDSYPTAPLFVQPETTYTTHEREMGLYLTLISRVDPSHSGDTFSTGYDHYLRDALYAIQSQHAYALTSEDLVDTNARQSRKHKLNMNDPIISLLLESLRKFFSNTPEFNMALTGVLATLALHPDRSLAGWLTFSHSDQNRMNTSGKELEKPLDDGDGDDRSIDFQIDEQLANDTRYLPASTMDEQSRPILHTIFYSLVTQLERYRQSVEDFDKYLLERRQGLLFSENLTDALNLALEVIEEPAPAPPAPPVETTPQRPKAKSIETAASSLVSFLTPKKSKAKPTTSAGPSSPPKLNIISKSVSASPFGPHYQHTKTVVVEPFIALLPSNSPWSPSKPSKWPTDEEDVFSTGWGEQKPDSSTQDFDEEDPAKPAQITLSRLLDNVVILEEGIKELVAIIHARRSLGIDSVRYL
ncbi:hypothetical protein BDN72DRAFT_867415 [Pluteus cervinus]|uniref:Uncharacterized protein n=1 Tax=Pluteus cervinus TaxID=181527 RepID=A0ACD3BEI8_9AGAR|nr:hypothetical protein BDN72DRAFT_867415 [Pluteus cervinus]